jgi:hypothetical protein
VPTFLPFLHNGERMSTVSFALTAVAIWARNIVSWPIGSQRHSQTWVSSMHMCIWQHPGLVVQGLVSWLSLHSSPMSLRWPLSAIATSPGRCRRNPPENVKQSLGRAVHVHASQCELDQLLLSLNMWLIFSIATSTLCTSLALHALSHAKYSDSQSAPHLSQYHLLPCCGFNCSA